MSINEHPLDQFWVLTDKQADGLVAFISVARHRTHHRADGSNIIAISPAFKNAEDTRAGTHKGDSQGGENVIQALH